MELEQLKQLDAIYRLGTVSAAAQELHISQPSVSRSIHALELELGQSLFDRTKNRMELNEAGRLAVQHAQAILAEERRMIAAFDELAKRKRTIVVGSVAPAPVWRLTAQTVERFPGTILSSERLTQEEVVTRLMNRTIDLAITTRPMVLPTMTSVPIMNEDLFFFVTNDHPLARASSASFSQMDGESFLVDASAGFWIDMVRRSMPHSTIIEQQDRNVLVHLIHTTNLTGFVTNAAQYINLEGERTRIPIADADAHVTFFLTSLNDTSDRVLEIVEWMRQIAGNADSDQAVLPTIFEKPNSNTPPIG